ncbi:MAG: CDP-alcohol phosphatidyltransferase [Deltaproteobacteria bacterium]|nr:MAG: CDP-alcohol phosphatidyltransferase [Deltaproteobacteria bacterium]
MKAVILAAGQGRRLSGGGVSFPKVLAKVAGRELLYRHLKLLRERGVEEFIVVVNPWTKAPINDALLRWGFPFRLVINERPELGNGYSLLQARDYVDGTFFVVMGDHVYEEAFLDEAIKGQGLIVDRRGEFIDRDEATKVILQDGRVRDIGKDVPGEWYDTGFFVLDREIFDHAEAVLKEKGKVEMSDVVKRAELRVTEVSGRLWLDVDTPQDLKRATRFIVRRSVKPTGDGLISRVINRRLSLLLSERLVNRLSPNQASLLSTLVGLLASLFASISPPLGGVLYQVSSILDGTDGEIARSSMKESAFGGWMDSILDRVVDFSFLLSLGLFLGPGVSWPVVALAIFGSLMVSYTSERYRAATQRDLYEDIPLLLRIGGKRDERIFLVMFLCILEMIEECLWALALWTNARLLAVLFLVWRKGRKGA